MDDALEESLRNNRALQADEIQALSAIFGDDWIEEDREHRVYSIEIVNSSGNSIYFQITLTENYPLDAPPIYQISAPWMSREAKTQLCSEIEDIYCSNAGESIIYLWIEKLREFFYPTSDVSQNSNAGECLNSEELTKSVYSVQEFSPDKDIDLLPPVSHGEPIVDRKSVFQAHVARVVSVEQVKQVLNELKQNRKIASATHNVYAYRIARDSKNSFLQDCEDDGETKAGSVLLRLLQILNAQDVLVVVSRWYGGIHLGPDRFKHVNNAARILLCEMGFTRDEKAQTGSSKSPKK